MAVGPGTGFVFAAAEPWEPRPFTDDPAGLPGGTPAGDQASRIIVRYAKGADEGEARANILAGVEGTRSLEVLSSANAEVFAVGGDVEGSVKAAEEVPGVRYVRRASGASGSSARTTPSTSAAGSGLQRRSTPRRLGARRAGT